MGELLNDVCGGPLPVAPSRPSSRRLVGKILKFGERLQGQAQGRAGHVDYDWGVEDVPMDFDSLGMIGTMGALVA